MIKKRHIFLIMIICLFAISAVSAADNTTNDIISIEETSDDVASVENYDVNESLSEGINILKANSDGTFTDLANDIAGANGELKLTRNYVYDSSKDSNYKDGIVIDKEITINGRGFIINGNDNARAFNVASDNVTLRNIEFTNCFSSGFGGGIYWNGNNGSCYDCNFINCNSSTLGGAIYWNGNNGNLFDCNFLDCSCSISHSGSTNGFRPEGSSTKSGFGGAVYWNGNNGNLYNCNFNNCKNYIYTSHTSSGSSFTAGVIPDSTSTSHSSSFGGAIYWNGTNGDLYNCDFINCYSYSHSSSYSNTMFNPAAYSNNYVSSSSTCYSYSYGVYWNGTRGNLSGCSFINSSSSYSSDYNSETNEKNLLEASTSSSSSSSGGAVYWNGDNGNLFDCNFINPTYYSSSSPFNKFGGAVYWNGNDGNILNSSFINYHILKSYANAIHWHGDNGNILNCSFINSNRNTSGVGYDVAVYWQGDNGNIYNCGFDGKYYNYEKYCKAEKSVYPIILIHDSSFNNDERIVLFDSTPLVNNISVKLYDVTDRKILYDEFNISSEDLIHSLNLNKLHEGDYQIVLEYAGDTFYSATSTNDLFKIGKNASYEVSINEIIDVGENVTLNLTLNEDTTGQVRITVANYTYINELVDGKVSISIPCEIGELNEYKIKYIGDEKYNPIYINDTFIVLYKSDMSLNLKDNYIYGENIPFNYNITANCTGTVNVFVDDIYKANISFGEVFELEDIDFGEHNITLTYNGDRYHTTCSNSTTITISKADTFISDSDVSVAYKDPNGFIITIINEHGKPIAANLTVNFNGEDYTVTTDSNGQAKIPIDTLKPGTYTTTITYKGSSNYNPATTTSKVTVTKADTIISTEDVSLTYKSLNGEILATITNEHGKPLVVSLNVNFNGKDYTVRTDSNGRASIPIGTLTPGTYSAIISYKGSGNYKASTATAKVTVTKAATNITAQDVSLAYKDPNGKLVATITNEHGKPLVVNLNVNINGKTYTAKTDSNGQANIPLDTITPGTYTATITYKGSNNYKTSTTTAKITITKAETSITAQDVSHAYKDPNGKLTPTITNEHGKPLVVNLNIDLNGKTYNVKTDSNGQANIPLDTITPGTYTATITYKGSNNYKTSTTTAKITITKAETIISVPDVAVAYKDINGELVPTITNEHGKPLVVNLNVDINGNTYTARTDSNGQISVSTEDLTPGTYTATITYKGSNNYKASTATAKVKVTNADTPVSTSDISVIYNVESKEIIATLTGSNGEAIGNAKLVFNLLDMDYSLTTDSKGQAKFSTQYLESGMYTITVSYEGNYAYSSSSKSVKVII